jgi:replicative DNA helicase
MSQKKKTSAPTNTVAVSSEYGKLPPQVIELEEVVLGALMLEKNAFDYVAEIIKADSFYKDSHKIIYEAIENLVKKHLPVDILTVTEELRSLSKLDEAGGAYYITYLTSRVSSAANITYHSRIIAQKYIQRELIRITSEIQTKAYDDTEDVNNLLEYSEEQIYQVSSSNIKKEPMKMGPLISEAMKQIYELSLKKKSFSGVPSGFTRIDHITSGWQKSDLIIIAGRPSMGKTAFVLAMARNTAIDFNIQVAIFSLEMSAVQLVNRLIVSETEIYAEKIRNGKLSQSELLYIEEKISSLSQAPVFIDDTPAISILELNSKCRRLKKQNEKLELIIIDYLQLMTTGTDMKVNREQEVSIISRSLKSLAKELNIPIIALSQLNRAVETRTERRPQLSDLRESGAIEQDADLVLLIHRPEKYGREVDEYNNSLKGIAELIIAKHRNGATGEVRLKFREEFAKFTELDYDESNETVNSMQPESITFSSKMNTGTGKRYSSEKFRHNKEEKNNVPF